MACQSADLIAGIASLAGTTFLNPSNCAPLQPVNILHFQGTADTLAPYGRGAATMPGFPANMPAFPGALQTVQIWAGYNGARDPVTDASPSLDLTLDPPGLDTIITRYTNSAPAAPSNCERSLEEATFPHCPRSFRRWSSTGSSLIPNREGHKDGY